MATGKSVASNAFAENVYVVIITLLQRSIEWFAIQLKESRFCQMTHEKCDMISIMIFWLDLQFLYRKKSNAIVKLAFHHDCKLLTIKSSQ